MCICNTDLFIHITSVLRLSAILHWITIINASKSFGNKPLALYYFKNESRGVISNSPLYIYRNKDNYMNLDLSRIGTYTGHTVIYPTLCTKTKNTTKLLLGYTSSCKHSRNTTFSLLFRGYVLDIHMFIVYIPATLKFAALYLHGIYRGKDINPVQLGWRDDKVSIVSVPTKIHRFC